ncbi:solute carrier family 22 member 20-like [Macrobrachium rosenbergii]|uniref:solute carrier family 22 member 20-like n=1 Tax=Macrobrachium rosenbergii TaxID=79674 RepID=UPI0034D46B5D
MISTLDELLAQLGTGWWDVIHYVVAIFCLSLPASQALGGAFFAPAVDYTCVPTVPSATASPEAASETSAERGGPSSWRLAVAPENSTALNQCSYLVESAQTGEVAEEACSEWLFDNSTFATTLTAEFQLTCDRAYLRATYQSIYMLGMFLGALISGFAADRFGRKTTLLFGLPSFMILSNATCLLPNLSALLFSRFLLGLTMPFITNISYILVVEISEPRLRPHLGILMMLPWAFGMMILGGFVIPFLEVHNIGSFVIPFLR